MASWGGPGAEAGVAAEHQGLAALGGRSLDPTGAATGAGDGCAPSQLRSSALRNSWNPAAGAKASPLRGSTAGQRAGPGPGASGTFVPTMLDGGRGVPLTDEDTGARSQGPFQEWELIARLRRAEASFFKGGHCAQGGGTPRARPAGRLPAAWPGWAAPAPRRGACVTRCPEVRAMLFDVVCRVHCPATWGVKGLASRGSGPGDHIQPKAGGKGLWAPDWWDPGIQPVTPGT